MNYVLNWILSLKDGVTAPIGAVTKAANGLDSAMANSSKSVMSFGDRMFKFNQVASAISGVESALQGIVQPGAAFDGQLKSLSSITGVVGKDLDALGLQARSLSTEFGGSAADNVESMKLIISKLGPEITSNQPAFEAMTRNIQLLSKASGLDAPQAVDALSTSMLQFQVNLKDPIGAAAEMAKMMDVMSAASVAGSAEIPQISQALANSGNAAYNAGLSFKETNALIQVLGKSSLYGAEAGTSLRNMLLILGKGRFMEKDAAEGLTAAGVSLEVVGNATIPFAQRLKELSKIGNDSALITKIFGQENTNAALGIMQNLGAYDEYLGKLDEVGVAQSQAATNMSSFPEIMSRVEAKIQNVGISIFEATKPILPFVLGASQVATGLASLAPLLELGTLAMNGLNLAFLSNPIVIAAAAIAAVGVGLYLFYQNSEQAREAIDRLFVNVKEFGTIIWNLLEPALQAMWTAFVKVSSVIGSLLGSQIIQWVQSLSATVSNVVAWIQDFYNRILSLVNSPFAQWIQGILTYLDALWVSIAQGAASVGDSIIDSFAWVSTLFDYITGIYDYALSKVQAITAKIGEYIQPVLAFFGQDKASVELADWGYYSEQKQKPEPTNTSANTSANQSTETPGVLPPTGLGKSLPKAAAAPVAKLSQGNKQQDPTTTFAANTSQGRSVIVNIKSLVEKMEIRLDSAQNETDLQTRLTELLVRVVSDSELALSN